MSPIEIEFDMLVRAIQEKNNPLMMQYFNTLIIDMTSVIGELSKSEHLTSQLTL